ncbi:DUF2797 domain-containing protein [Facilibium subflavum]|uniref:DUF2797 domain-containing protein n=1 Tax=Facilibium subflavum TaxID=2219058 RepID=UPI0013C2FA85|nr:DUF2797 domain-containing protein [Facilibium subflavum]
MDCQLHLSKMKTSLDDTHQAQYYLARDQGDPIYMNDCIGKSIEITFLNEIHCVACGRKTNKSFNQGYCFVCFRTLAECDSCIIKPELCHYYEGTCRMPEWGQAHCLQPHFVYLANTGGVKVGITRLKNTPMRWIDQGATQALPILKVNQRLISGVIEVEFKKYVADRTHWQTMLKKQPDEVDLFYYKGKLLHHEADFLTQIQQKYGAESITFLESQELKIHYPVIEYPTKVKSFNLDKLPTVSGCLMGIKGQYLILDTGVINLRKFGGYFCRFQAK